MRGALKAHQFHHNVTVGIFLLGYGTTTFFFLT